MSSFEKLVVRAKEEERLLQEKLAKLRKVTSPAVGDRVVRGPDWCDGDIDGKGEGTVSSISAGPTSHISDSLIAVKWDCGPFQYKYNYCAKKYHVKPVDSEKVERYLAAANKRDFYATAAAATTLSKIGALLDDSTYSDVEVKCGDTVFNAHKAIITSQSNVFVKMLKEGMVEGDRNKIEVKEMEPDIFEMLMRFLYEGSVDVDAKTGTGVVCALYDAAHMYEVSALEILIENRLIEKLDDGIDAEDVVQVIILADLHGNENVKNRAIEYVRKNKKTVLETTSWKELKEKRPKFVIEVLEKL